MHRSSALCPEIGRRSHNRSLQGKNNFKWQRRWNDEDRRRWTADIRPWIGQKFGEPHQYVTQMLSGYGYFRKYLHRTRKTGGSYCLYEEGEVINDAEHNVFECALWQSYRSVMTPIIGTIMAANTVVVMIVNREKQA